MCRARPKRQETRMATASIFPSSTRNTTRSPPFLVTSQQQSCCTWAFENTNKCRAGLWPRLTPLCRANLPSSFWMTRVWIRAICLNLRNIFSHNRTQLALTTAHNTEKSNCCVDSTLWAIQEQTNWSVSPVWQSAWALQSAYPSPWGSV